MEYIAIAVNNDNELKKVMSLGKRAHGNNLDFITEQASEIDIEVRDGIISYIDLFDLTLIKVIRESTSSKVKTSSGISDDISNLFLSESKSLFIDFLLSNKNILPEKFLLVFAFEWHINESVRFKSIDINNLENYFRENNSWYFWLYDYFHDSYKPNLDIPLILEISNTKKI